jgi:hypothetical protein
MDTRFQPSRSGPPRNEAALEEIRRLFARYRAHPDLRARPVRDRQVQTLPPREAGRIPDENPISR